MKKVFLLYFFLLSARLWGQGESGIEWNVGLIQPGIISVKTPTVINRIDAQVIIEDRLSIDAMMNFPIGRLFDFERNRNEYLKDQAQPTLEARLGVSTVPWTFEKSNYLDEYTEEAKVNEDFYDQKKFIYRVQFDGGLNYFQSALTEDISVTTRPSELPGLGNSITERLFLSNKSVLNTHLGLSYVWNIDFINRPKGKDVVKNVSHRVYVHFLYNTNNNWVVFQRTEEFRNVNGTQQEVVTIEELEDVEDIEEGLWNDNFGFRMGLRIFSRKDNAKYLNYSFLNVELMRCPLPGLYQGNETVFQATLGFGIGSKR